MTEASASKEVTDEWVAMAEARFAHDIDEAKALRIHRGLPSLEEGAVEVLARLADVRRNLDQAEVLLSELGRFRTGLRVALKSSVASVDDAWAEKVAGTGGGSRGNRASFGGFEDAPRERYARADVAVLGLRINARNRQRVFDAVNDTYDFIDGIRRGLDSTRYDLHALLRIMSIPEHRLDRTDAGTIWS
jgi:hypothetical protein